MNTLSPNDDRRRASARVSDEKEEQQVSGITKGGGRAALAASVRRRTWMNGSEGVKLNFSPSEHGKPGSVCEWLGSVARFVTDERERKRVSAATAAVSSLENHLRCSFSPPLLLLLCCSVAIVGRKERERKSQHKETEGGRVRVRGKRNNALESQCV